MVHGFVTPFPSENTCIPAATLSERFVFIKSIHWLCLAQKAESRLKVSFRMEASVTCTLSFHIASYKAV